MSLRDLPVHDVMTADVVSFQPDQNVTDAMQLLVARGVDAGPVVDARQRWWGCCPPATSSWRRPGSTSPRVVNFLGGTCQPLRAPEAGRLGGQGPRGLGGRGHDGRAADRSPRRQRRGRGHADARPGRVAPARDRRRWRPRRHRQPGRHRQGHRPGTGDATLQAEPAGRRRRPTVHASGPRSTSTPWPTTSRARRLSPRPSCARWSRPTATATVRWPWRRRPLDAGASWLGVALVEEGAVLRRAGHRRADPAAVRAPPRRHRRRRAPRPAAARLHGAGRSRPGRGGPATGHDGGRVHLKVNTGMNRVGARPPTPWRPGRGRRRRPELELEALWTHCAVADEPANPFTDVQLDRFDAVVGRARRGARPGPAAAPRGQHRGGHRSPAQPLRPGPRRASASTAWRPAPALAERVDLVPALTLRAEVAMVKRVPPASASPTASPTPSPATPTWPPCPSATPTAWPAGCRRGGEVLIGGSAPPDRGRHHHGPARWSTAATTEWPWATRWCSSAARATR